MIPRHQPGTYFTGCNENLARAVPPSAQVILEVGCGTGQLGARLKELQPQRRVYGIERHPAAAAEARRHLDQVFELDLEKDDAPLPPGSVDCILYGDVLEHLVDPEAVLRRQRALLRPEGCILCSIPNIQHFSVLAELLRGDFQYADAGLLDATHLRFFTYSTIVKMLLDRGYAPEVVATTALPCPPAFLQAAQPLLNLLGVHPGRASQYLGAYQYIVRGRPVSYLGQASPLASEPPLSFVVCVSREPVLRANLLSSPCLAPGSPHEVLLMRNCPSAAEGLNRGIAQAKHPWVVCVHQDVYLPEGWPRRFVEQLRRAEASGPVGVAGVYGVSLNGEAVQRAGFIVDRDRLLHESAPLPADVETLDEVVLAVPRNTELCFDERLGFHFYGADLCLAARARGLRAVCLDALCFHNSSSVDLPPEFAVSGRAFAAKWKARLPVATSCVRVDPSWLTDPVSRPVPT